MSAEVNPSVGEPSPPIESFFCTLITRRNFFALSGLLGIPGTFFLSHASRTSAMDPWLINILFFACMLIPAVFTYRLASLFFSKTKAGFLAFGMFVPTIVVPLIVLVGLWLSVNRAIATRKRA